MSLYGPRLFVLLLIVYLGLHSALRLAVSGTAQYDEAEQFLFCQGLRLGYGDQPPLYTWLLWCWLHLAGISLAALILFKFTVLAGLYVMLYWTARCALRDGRLAFLATFSLLLMPAFAWESIRDQTHTPLLCLVCAATLHTALRLIETRATRYYVWLGVLLGLGFLSKYTYVLFAGGLFLSALTVPALRPLLANRRLLLSAGICFAIAAPHGYWLLEHGGLVRDMVVQKARLDWDGGFVLNRVVGSAILAGQCMLVVAPFGLACLVFFPSVARRAADLPAAEDLPGRLLHLFFPIVVGLVLVLAVCIGGASHIEGRWLQPFALAVPLWFFGRMRGVAIAPGRLHKFACVLVGMALLSVSVRALQLGWGGAEGGKYQGRDEMIAQVASEVQARGGGWATILSDTPEAAGNLRLHFPHGRFLSAYHPAFHYPATEANTGLYVIVWKTVKGDAPRPELEAYVNDKLRGELGLPAPISLVDWRPQYLGVGRYRVGYVVLSPAILRRGPLPGVAAAEGAAGQPQE